MPARRASKRDTAKDKLVGFLDRRVFDRILRASPARRSETDRKALEEVRKKTAAEKERFHRYGSAGIVRRMFRDDVERSAKHGPARRVNEALERLGLPRLADVKDEFLRRADQLGVSEEREHRTPHRRHRPHPQHKKTPQARAAARHELEQIRERERERRAKRRSRGSRASATRSSSRA